VACPSLTELKKLYEAQYNFGADGHTLHEITGVVLDVHSVSALGSALMEISHFTREAVRAGSSILG